MQRCKSFLIKDILESRNDLQSDSESSQQDCHSCINGDQAYNCNDSISISNTPASSFYPPTASLWPSFAAAAAAASCISCIKPIKSSSTSDWSSGLGDNYAAYQVNDILGDREALNSRQVNNISSDSSSECRINSQATIHSTISSSRKVRRNRTVFTELQLMGLERRFDSQKYLSTPDRAELARVLGLTQLQVKTWYQNRRMKWKKQVMQGGCPIPPTKPKGRPKKNSIPSLGMNFDPSLLCSSAASGLMGTSGSPKNIQSIIQAAGSLVSFARH